MKKLMILPVLCCVTLTIRAFDGNFEAKRNVTDGGYNFWMYTPADYETDMHPLPLMIFLRGTLRNSMTCCSG